MQDECVGHKGTTALLQQIFSRNKYGLTPDAIAMKQGHVDLYKWARRCCAICSPDTFCFTISFVLASRTQMVVWGRIGLQGAVRPTWVPKSRSDADWRSIHFFTFHRHSGFIIFHSTCVIDFIFYIRSFVSKLQTRKAALFPLEPRHWWVTYNRKL